MRDSLVARTMKNFSFLTVALALNVGGGTFQKGTGVEATSYYEEFVKTQSKKRFGEGDCQTDDAADPLKVRDSEFTPRTDCRSLYTLDGLDI